MINEFASRVAEGPPTAAVPRLFSSLWRQSVHNPRCPAEPRLDGRLALVTGGGRGIGLDTSRGLAARGAEVTLAARGEKAGQQAASALQQEFGVPARFASLDLSDLDSVAGCIDALDRAPGRRPLDCLVANAGLWPTRYQQSAAGHEIAFATNVLGHYALIRGLLDRGLLADGARVILVTGDIYILTRHCTPDFRYRSAFGGQLAYCRSKLGNLWLTRELARRVPTLQVHAVHPGVIASELSGGSTGVAGAVKRAAMLSTEAGAQTSLFCATQPGLENGGYYHNVLGHMQLRADDPAADDAGARALWETLEGLAPTPAR